MTKFTKKSVSVIMAAITAAALSVSMLAATAADCEHINARKTELGSTITNTSRHIVQWRGNSGNLDSEYCYISTVITEYVYKCTSCSVEVSDHIFVTTEEHSSTHCSHNS